MPSTSLTYRTLVRAATTLAPLAGLFDAKLRRTVAVRRGVIDRFRAWGATQRDPNRPLAWFHAPSVGEGLQARAVMDVFRARHQDWQVAYTYFSPSAEAFAGRLGADFADCLPFDTLHAVEAVLEALRPSLLVFTKLDVWPELATRAAARAIPTAVVAATVRPGSGRLGARVKALLQPGYRSLAAAGAVSDEDAGRLVALGVVSDRIQVTGDPRADSVLSRVEAATANDPLIATVAGDPMLVAGSTWPADEDLLLEAFKAVLPRHPSARLMLAPHEPTPEALIRVQRRAEALGLEAPVHLGQAGNSARLILVNRVGVLATLYGAGSIAWVGGGFGTAGLHSVLEPAAWGIPVLFGPRWQESRDAAMLYAGHAARPITDAASLAENWLDLLEDESARHSAGDRARQLAISERGAALRSVILLETLI